LLMFIEGNSRSNGFNVLNRQFWLEWNFDSNR
jgi:hypothetical protein